MKNKDYAVIIAVIFVAGIFSFVICSQFISSPKNRQQKAEVVEPITPEFQLPDNKIFNTNAVNPTKLIEIGPNSNNQPFVEL